VGGASDVAFIFDSDALIQIFLAGQKQAFSILASEFGVRSYLMNEVDVELRSNKKFGALIKPNLEKTLKNGSLKLLSAADLDSLADEQSSPVSLQDIRSLGREYALDVGTGEAYTHAAGILLNTPTVSNDMNAIRTLEMKGKELPPTILRSFDIFGFLFSEGCIDAHAAEQILKELKAQGERLPHGLSNSSFSEGVMTIHCRLATSLAVAASTTGWSAPFYLKRRG